MQHQEGWDQVGGNEDQRQLGHGSGGRGAVEIGSEDWDQCSEADGHGQVQNAGKIPGNKTFACGKTGAAQKSGQYEWSGDTDRHVA